MIYHKCRASCCCCRRQNFESFCRQSLRLRLSRHHCLYEARTSLWFCPRPCRGERDWLCSIFYWCLHLCNLSNVFNHGLLRRLLHATHIYWSFKRVACIWGNQMLVQSNLSKFCHWDCKWPKTWSKAWSKTWSKSWSETLSELALANGLRLGLRLDSEQFVKVLSLRLKLALANGLRLGPRRHSWQRTPC